jgi:hypothetical protein
MQHRSDRFVCKLKDYSLNGLEIQPIRLAGG